jgi:ribosomal protein L13
MNIRVILSRSNTPIENASDKIRFIGFIATRKLSEISKRYAEMARQAVISSIAIFSTRIKVLATKLSKNKLRNRMMTRLRLYNDSKHNHKIEITH